MAKYYVRQSEVTVQRTLTVLLEHYTEMQNLININVSHISLIGETGSKRT